MSDDLDQPVSKDGEENRRSTVTSTRSANARNRFSIASTETGESSKPTSVVEDSAGIPDHSSPRPSVENRDVTESNPGRRGSRRSYKGRSSGGFLLPNNLLDPSSDTNSARKSTSPTSLKSRALAQESRGKGAVRTPDKKHTTKRSSVGLGIGGSPLAANVTNAENEPSRKGGVIADDDTKAGPSGGLDVDSAQIVSLALNLSESRRNAARRNVSSPLPPTLSGFADGFAGGSLRQHLQQQRRTSRNVSPKPDRNELGFTTSTRGQQVDPINSPWQGAFESHDDGTYNYQFSTSTLARAEKAKTAIELMAQYRRLLQYVPPLKPQGQKRELPSNLVPGVRANSSPNSSSPLGRTYNPLQYIRNRKFRLRDRKPIDGEALGFTDISRVTSWVDRVAKDSAVDDYHRGECVDLPPIMDIPEPKTPQHSRQSSLSVQGTTGRLKRPRNDWITAPADMLGDIVWLETGDNKKLIEDAAGHKLFPQDLSLIRPASREDYSTSEPDISPKNLATSFRSEPELTSINTAQNGSLHGPDLDPEGPQQTAYDKAPKSPKALPKRHSRKERGLTIQTESKPSTIASESDLQYLTRRRKNTKDDSVSGDDILKNQMMEMLAREASNDEWKNTYTFPKPDDVIQSIEVPHPSVQENGGRQRPEISMVSSGLQHGDRHRRTDSATISTSQPPSGRASLEVPSHLGRSSLDGFDSTAPNSPQTRASKIINAFIPGLSMDVSPRSSRRNSPARLPTIERVRSKISLFRDRSRDRGKDDFARQGSVAPDDEQDLNYLSPGSPTTPEYGRRSVFKPRKSEESIRSSSKTRIGGRKDEDTAGVRGLFKQRHPRGHVGDLFLKKEESPASVVSSNASSDDSDLEDNPFFNKMQRPSLASKTSSRGPSGELSPDTEPVSYFIDLPRFESTLEARRRSGRPAIDARSSTASGHLSQLQKAREERRQSRFNLLKPPEIDVRHASGSSSPDSVQFSRSARNSDISDHDTHRGSYSSAIQGADARLNAVLGLPGSINRTAGLGVPVTGLSNIEAGHPNIVGNRQWPLPELVVSTRTAPMTKRELARVRTLLLSSGVKAKELTRRADSLRSINDPSPFSAVGDLARDPTLQQPAPRSETHLIAARIVSSDIQLSSRLWQDRADHFSTHAVSGLLDRIEDLQNRISGREGMSEMGATAADEADEVSRDITTGQTLKVKSLVEAIETMARRRRRRFRWIRRGGWMMVEWALVGVMWLVWLVVVLIKGTGTFVKGVVTGVRWLFWI